MQFHTVVLTAPRPKSTLLRTLESIQRAGFRDFDVFSGAPPDGEKPSAKWCTAAYKRLLSLENPSWGNAEALLVFEDDVVVCKGLYDYLCAIPWPEPIQKIAMVSPYCHTAYSDYCDFGRWHREDQRTTLAGTQAFLYTRHAAEAMADYLKPDRLNENGDYLGVDVQMGWFARDAGLHVHYHIPSLVQHVGIRNSAVGFTEDLGTIYSAQSFPGEDFDARSMV